MLASFPLFIFCHRHVPNITLKVSTMNCESTRKTPHTRNSHCCNCSTSCFITGRCVYSSIWPAVQRTQCSVSFHTNPQQHHTSDTSPLTRTIKQYVVILHMTKTLLQPFKVVDEVLHTEDQSSIGTESQRVILHNVINLDKFSNVCIQL